MQKAAGLYSSIRFVLSLCASSAKMVVLSHTIILVLGCLGWTVAAPAASNLHPRADGVVNQTSCSGKQYTYQQLAGYGPVPSNARDSFGDTLGGYGSSIVIDRKSWRKLKNGTYTGTLYAIPDRGWYFALPFTETSVEAEYSQ